MKYAAFFVVFLVSAALADDRLPATRPAATQPAVQDIQAFFSPHGGCTQTVLDQISQARTSIDMQAYSFTSLDIAKSLEDAVKRGVRVRVILDRKASRNQPQAPTYLFNHGVPTWTDGRHPIAHNKVIVVDGKIILTGSFNFTKQAESNAENLLVITGHPYLADEFEKHFEEHFSHAEKYEGPK